MLRGLSHVDFDRPMLSLLLLLSSSGRGSTGAMEKNAALKVAIRIGLEGEGEGGLGVEVEVEVGLERRRSGQRKWEVMRVRFLLRSLNMMDK